MKTLELLNCRLFTRGIHRSPDSPHNEPEMQSFDFSFVISLDKLLDQLSSRRWFHLTVRWRHCNTVRLTLCEGTAKYIPLTKGQWCWTYIVSFNVSLAKLLDKQSNCRSFETPLCPTDITAWATWHQVAHDNLAPKRLRCICNNHAVVNWSTQRKIYTLKKVSYVCVYINW